MAIVKSVRENEMQPQKSSALLTLDLTRGNKHMSKVEEEYEKREYAMHHAKADLYQMTRDLSDMKDGDGRVPEIKKAIAEKSQEVVSLEREFQEIKQIRRDLVDELGNIEMKLYDAKEREKKERERER